MALEQTLFPIQRSVFQPGTVPALFSLYQEFVSSLFYNSDCTSGRNVNSAFSLGIQFQDESTSNGATPI